MLGWSARRTRRIWDCWVDEPPGTSVGDCHDQVKRSRRFTHSCREPSHEPGSQVGYEGQGQLRINIHLPRLSDCSCSVTSCPQFLPPWKTVPTKWEPKGILSPLRCFCFLFLYFITMCKVTNTHLLYIQALEYIIQALGLANKPTSWRERAGGSLNARV